MNENESEPSHGKSMKTQENMGFLPPLEAMGRSEGVESRFKLTKPNKINGFVACSLFIMEVSHSMGSPACQRQGTAWSSCIQWNDSLVPCV